MSRLLIYGVSPLPFETTERSFGPGTRTWQITEPLLEDGHTICLVGMRIPNTYPDDAPQEIIRRDGNLTYQSITDGLYNSSPYVQNVFNGIAPDAVIFAHGAASFDPELLDADVPVWIDLCGHVMAEAQAKAAVYEDDSYLDYFMDRVTGALFRGDAFSTVSEAQKFALIGELGLAGRLNSLTNGHDLVHTIPCGVEEREYRHYGNVVRGVDIEHNTFVILWSGGFNTWTDIETMFEGVVQAMDRVDSIRFVATGGAIDGHDELTYPRFVEMVESSPHREKFVLKGWVPRDTVPNYYFEADVGINCEKDIYEVRLGSKHRILDWSRAGLPVVTTRVTELSETVEREGVGFVCPPGDPEALAAAILDAAHRRDELPEMGQRCKESLRRLYGFRATTEALRRWAAEPCFAPDRQRPRLCLEAALRPPESEPARETRPVPASERETTILPPPEGFLDPMHGVKPRHRPTRDTLSGIPVLGAGLAYEDHAEDRIVDILEQAVDRSSASDELASHIDDWPTSYHLSPLRANLLRPFTIGEGLRVLEVGAGCGAISRYLGETGARVVALEGNLARARAAALRCAGLDTVEVVCGTLDEYQDEEGFDLVVVVGVLEYAAAAAGGGSTAQAFLEKATSHLRPGGGLILAIENQLGLKYLLGYSEDHLGEPWAGLEGYPGGHGIATFTRRRLATLLEGAGLPRQRWLYPFPDYKLVKVIVNDDAYAEGHGPLLVDQLVRGPVRDLAHERLRLCDDRGAHRVFLEEGLGPEVANSFLVLATRDGANPDRFLPARSLAWHFGDGRRQVWARHQVVERTDDGLTVRGFSSTEPARERTRGWLHQSPVKQETFFLGPTLEQLALDACRSWRLDELRQVLGRWRAFLTDAEAGRPSELAAIHPCLAHGSDRILPPVFLDVLLTNFVVAGDRLEFVDREWKVVEGVESVLAMTRALWYLAHEIMLSGMSHPWPEETTVDELTNNLGQLCDLVIDQPLLASFRRAEAAFLAIVAGKDATEIEQSYAHQGALSRLSGELRPFLPHSVLAGQVARQYDRWENEARRAIALEQQLTVARDWHEYQRRTLVERGQKLRELLAEGDRLAAELRRLTAERDSLAAERNALFAERGAASAGRDAVAVEREELLQRLSSTEARLQTLAAWRAAFERRLTVRAYRALRGRQPWHDTADGEG